MPQSPPQPETIARLFDAVYPSFAMLAGMELDLFTPLKDGPLTGEQLADAIGVQAIKLKPLLYALVVAGLLTVEYDLFSNTAEADHYLVRGRPAYLGGLQDLTSNNWRRMLRAAETVRAGGPQAKLDYHTTSQNDLVALFRGLYPAAVADAHKLMKRFDFSTFDSLLDVGGGSGALAIAIAQANPHLKATVLELPSVAPITRQFIDEANISDRVAIFASDAIHDSPHGSYDVVVARHVTQVLSEKDSRALLSNLAMVLKPGGMIHLIGWILDDSRMTPENIVGYNLILLTAYQDGQAYTEQEYHEWLAEAGFTAFERVVFPDGASILTAHKPE
jgi:2-polyprenyl-3-methyl-5-hydroxy-6-metoxy-1,4-benzoquinol methylase